MLVHVVDILRVMELIKFSLGGRYIEQKLYEGTNFPNICPGNVADHLDKIRNLDYKQDDVFVMTYPRSGTHWIREIVSMLKKGKAEYIVNDDIDFPIELLDIDSIMKASSPRIFYSHMPFRYLPMQHLAQRGKVIGCFRNPRDVVTSSFHFFNKISYTVDWDEYFNHFMDGNLVYGCWFEWKAQWEQALRTQKDNPPLTLTYEDTSRDLEGQIRKIADYLDVTYNETLIADITSACTFENMRSAKSKTQSNMIKRIEDGIKSLDSEYVTQEDICKSRGGNNTVIRKGIVGDWKTLFTAEQNLRLNKAYREKTAGCDLVFDEYLSCDEKNSTIDR